MTQQLLLAGIEVALPTRDRGIDLIAYDERGGEKFVSSPIQMKASTASNFGIDRKYARTRGLRLAYIWNLNATKSAEPIRAFVLTFSEALNIGDTMGYTETDSWKKGGKYVVTRSPSRKLRALLETFEIKSASDWRARMFDKELS